MSTRDLANQGVTREVPGGKNSGTAAADEMNDFQPVAFAELCLGPLLARHNVAIEFDGNAIVLHSQLLYQGGER